MAGRSVRRTLDGRRKNQRKTITVKDSTRIYYKDSGNGPIGMFSHGGAGEFRCVGMGKCFSLHRMVFRVIAHERAARAVKQASLGSDIDGFSGDLVLSFPRGVPLLSESFLHGLHLRDRGGGVDC